MDARDAVDVFSSKVPLPSSALKRLSDEQRSIAFSIAHVDSAKVVMSIRAKIQERVEGLSEGAARDRRLRWIAEVLDPTLDRLELGVFSWESLLADIWKRRDQKSLRSFYIDCLRFNQVLAGQ